jgi:hypothetical protein
MYENLQNQTYVTHDMLTCLDLYVQYVCFKASQVCKTIIKGLENTYSKLEYIFSLLLASIVLKCIQALSCSWTTEFEYVSGWHSVKMQVLCISFNSLSMVKGNLTGWAVFVWKFLSFYAPPESLFCGSSITRQSASNKPHFTKEVRSSS